MRRWIRSRATASAAVLIGLAGACRSPYRESVFLESGEDSAGRSIVNLGIYDARSETLDASASLQLAEASGCDQFPSVLPTQDVDLLVGDPGLLAVDRLGRRRLAEHFGRHVLIGIVRPVRVDEIREWGVIPLDVFLLPVYALLFSRVAIQYGMRRDVIHDAIAIRLVDLEAGTVDAEVFTIMNRTRDRTDRMEKSVATAARVMRLGAAR